MLRPSSLGQECACRELGQGRPRRVTGWLRRRFERRRGPQELQVRGGGDLTVPGNGERAAIAVEIGERAIAPDQATLGQPEPRRRRLGAASREQEERNDETSQAPGQQSCPELVGAQRPTPGGCTPVGLVPRAPAAPVDLALAPRYQAIRHARHMRSGAARTIGRQAR